MLDSFAAMSASISARPPTPHDAMTGMRTARARAAVEAWIKVGITRVILGTAALTNPDFVKEAARAFPRRIVVAADAKGGKVATEGWASVSDVSPIDLGQRFEDAGVAAILFTDVDGDGLLQGVNVRATAALARAVRIPVIAS